MTDLMLNAVCHAIHGLKKFVVILHVRTVQKDLTHRRKLFSTKKHIMTVTEKTISALSISTDIPERLNTKMNYKQYIKYLKENIPFKNSQWNKENLYNYLVYGCCIDTSEYIDNYFKNYTDNEDLLKMLFEFLLDDDYDGSDCQISSAYYIARMDKALLEKYSYLLSESAKNPVDARNPLKYM